MSSQKAEKRKKSVLSKIVICGAAESGKTALVHRFVNDQYNVIYDATIGLDCCTKEMLSSGRHPSLKIQFWDFAGQERFQSETNNRCFMNADLAIVTLDLSKANAITKARHFADKLKEFNIPNVVIVGTKSDLPHAEGLTDDAIASFVQETADKLKADVSYQTTSAKDNKGVDELFQGVAKKVYKLPLGVGGEQPKQPAWKRDSDCPKVSFFKRHQTSMVVGGVAVGSMAGLLYGLILNATISAPLAIGIGCAMAALALLVIAGKSLYDHHQQRQNYASI